MRLPHPTPNPVLLYLYRAGRKLKKSHVLFYCISEFAPPSGRSRRRNTATSIKEFFYSPCFCEHCPICIWSQSPSELLWKYTTDLLQPDFMKILWTRKQFFYPILKRAHKFPCWLLHVIYWNAWQGSKRWVLFCFGFSSGRGAWKQIEAITVTAEKQKMLLFLGFIRSSLPTINHNDILHWASRRVWRGAHRCGLL